MDSMRKVKPGDTVRVNYTGRLKDGKVFDTTEGCGCYEFIIGKDGVVPVFEEAVIGMYVGDTKTVTLEAENVFGSRSQKPLLEIDRQQWPKNLKPVSGEIYEIKNGWGEKMIVTVVYTTASHIYVDSNHPLAGEDLVFNIHLIEIL